MSIMTGKNIAAAFSKLVGAGNLSLKLARSVAIIAFIFPSVASAETFGPTAYWCWAYVKPMPGGKELHVATQVRQSRSFADYSDFGGWQNATGNKWQSTLENKFGKPRILSQICSVNPNVTMTDATEARATFVRTAKYYGYEYSDFEMEK